MGDGGNLAAGRLVEQGMRMRMAVTVAVGALATLMLLPAAGHAASCAGQPLESAHRFVGVVQAVDVTGRIATVRSADGRTVTVRGGPSQVNAMTTTDRSYAVGVWYEFHPVNDADPYEDNVCTATHELTSAPAGGVSAGLPDAGGGGAGWWPQTVIAVLVVVAAVVIVLPCAARC